MVHAKKIALGALKALGIFFSWLWFCLMGFWDWAKLFPVVESVSGFLFPKIGVFVLGKLITPFPLWVLVALSFVPPPILMLIYFLTIIVVLKQ